MGLIPGLVLRPPLTWLHGGETETQCPLLPRVASGLPTFTAASPAAHLRSPGCFLPISLGQWVMSLGAPGSAHCLLLQLSVPTELLASRDFSFFSCNLSCTSETLLWFKRQVHPEGRLCISFVGHVIIPASLFFLSRAISDPLGGISGCTSFDKNV